MNTVRGLIFNVFYALSVLMASVPVVILGPFLGFQGRIRLFAFWTRVVLWYLRIICGIRVRVIGQDNIPSQPVVVVLF